MKKFNTLIAFLTFIGISAFTQTSTERIYIKGGSSARENFMKEIYRYPAFEYGIVEYKDGKRYKSNMNFNKALGSIQFIDEKGDTLAMNDEESIRSINIGSDEFVFKPMCMLVMIKGGNVSMYKTENVRIADKQKTGAFGIPNTAGTIESIDRLDTRPNYREIDINESLLVSKVTTFYIENSKGKILPASKKNVLNMFSKEEDAIIDFIKTKNLDFNREDHLLELADFISKL